MRQYTVTTSASLSGSMQLQGTSMHNCKAAVSIAAPLIEGYAFSKWAEEGNQVSANASYQFIITKNRTLVAVYEKNQTIPATPAPATTVPAATTQPPATSPQTNPPQTSPLPLTEPEPSPGILKQINEFIRSNQAIVAAVITAAATIATSLMLKKKS